jgi:2-oxoglutarate ferredoxin oxidoreductase subunit gamma
LLTDSRFVTIERKIDAQQYELPMFESVMEKLKKPIVFNICMLGTVLGLTQVVQPDSIRKVLKDRIPSQFLELNDKALELGLELAETA